ncbi:CPBP family intramembrane glutamic endopeptidase [Amygdalobacter nucleatus]|uniref:CPBP family intramembrane glutamic endopeptidase n=1 Tax=Amygdalobacter nucleatus TaxID=3029274 RepID=UPI0026C95417|nr:CPBP family intramembrane glutamic endopeptidase [Amygdalobacter nucleatus]MDF0486116.1 CPBP family intramembrane metalloprotease [Amygdalobacter nucleatus]WEG37329.1 CPBP family intramembrane metalloprotease [Amygdalobacter nucleatus]
MTKRKNIGQVISHLVLGILVFLVSASLISEFIKLLLDNGVLKCDPVYAFTIAASLYSFVQIIAFSAWFRYKETVRTGYIWLNKVSLRNWFKLPSLCCFLLFLSGLLTNLINFLAKYFTIFANALQDYSDLLLQQLQPLNPMTLLAIVVMVPIAEEFLFRAFVVGELKQITSVTWACFISGLIFSIAHWNLLQSVYTFAAGLALACVYVWTGSIYYSIALHAIFNFCGLVFPHLVLRYPQFEIPYVLVLLTLALVGYFAFGNLYHQYMDKQQKVHLEADNHVEQ